MEHARMNALAGGPTNAYDAGLLERYGCYSGTRSAFCQGLAHRRYYRARRRVALLSCASPRISALAPRPIASSQCGLPNPPLGLVAGHAPRRDREAQA